VTMGAIFLFFFVEFGWNDLAFTCKIHFVIHLYIWLRYTIMMENTGVTIELHYYTLKTDIYIHSLLIPDAAAIISLFHFPYIALLLLFWCYRKHSFFGATSAGAAHTTQFVHYT
jgi:hypothetical protein